MTATNSKDHALTLIALPYRMGTQAPNPSY